MSGEDGVAYVKRLYRPTGSGRGPTGPRPKARPATGGPAPAWTAEFLLDDRGQPIPNVANAMVALRAAPEIQEALAYDEMLCAPLLVQQLPSFVDIGGAEAWATRPVRDADIVQLQEWLQHTGLPKIGKDTTHSAVDLRAQERAFHPVRDYLRSLAWDGTPRLESWLSRYLGADAAPYIGSSTSGNASATVPYNFAFPNAVLSVTATCIAQSGSLYGVQVYSQSKTNFTATTLVVGASGGAAAAYNESFFWMAIGY